MNYKKQMDIITTYNCKVAILYSELSKKLGISYHAMLVLFSIKQNEPCTQKMIANECLLSKQTVNSIIKDFQNKGYVSLKNGRNQKEKLIEYTENGKQFYNNISKEFERIEESVLKRIGNKESELLANEIKKFAEIFEEELNKYE